MAAGGWTEADMPDQADRTIVVTGANAGIGFQAARVLATRGEHVVLACRDTGKARQAPSASGPRLDRRASRSSRSI